VSTPFASKEVSWLSFNERVLQEASDPSVPLMERIRFMGIFSANLDEFFRVRVATLQRLARLGKQAKTSEGHNPKKVLKDVQDIALRQYQRFDQVYEEILRVLAERDIHFVTETELTDDQMEFLKSYFHSAVRPRISPLLIDQLSKLPDLRDDATYLAVILRNGAGKSSPKHALIEVPTGVLPRFLLLPAEGKKRYVMFLDDVVRFGLKHIFRVLHFTTYEAYAIKFTRDAELDFDDDVWDSYIKRVSRSLKHRKAGIPVRFVYDARIPPSLLQVLVKKLRLTKDDPLIPGGRYHNFRDFMVFPELELGNGRYEPLKPLFPASVDRRRQLTDSIAKRDILVHYPYQTFQYVVDFLREASIDPQVRSIKCMLYRIARVSSVANALINAARNGKRVTVVLELQARFDEENNIYWSNRLQEEGVRVLHGIPGLKVHAKLCQITRQEKKSSIRYAIIGTGNFNEETVRTYSDHCLFTADKRLTAEVAQVFQFCESTFRAPRFRHLWVAPFDMRKKLLRHIHEEIRTARKGREAFITIKVNNLAEGEVVRALYRAAQEGVQVRLIVRSMMSLIPGREGLSENIQAVGIVDRFLEHTRIFVFGGAGHPQYFISSADLMQRNLDRRLEVVCPIYDASLQKELQRFLDIQWADNVKSRVLDSALTNRIRNGTGGPSVRAQQSIYDYLKTQAVE
jgi:polyphosphate kinase